MDDLKPSAISWLKGEGRGSIHREHQPRQLWVCSRQWEKWVQTVSESEWVATTAKVASRLVSLLVGPRSLHQQPQPKSEGSSARRGAGVRDLFAYDRAFVFFFLSASAARLGQPCSAVRAMTLITTICLFPASGTGRFTLRSRLSLDTVLAILSPALPRPDLGVRFYRQMLSYGLWQLHPAAWNKLY